MNIKFEIKLNKDGITNHEIKEILEHLKDVTKKDIVSLCNGNSFLVGSKEGLRLEFSRNFK